MTLYQPPLVVVSRIFDILKILRVFGAGKGLVVRVKHNLNRVLMHDLWVYWHVGYLLVSQQLSLGSISDMNCELNPGYEI